MCQNTLKRQYASSPRKDKSEYERYEERDYKGLRRAQEALPVWQAHQLCRSTGETSIRGTIVACINQQPPQRGGAVPGPVWVGSKWLLTFPRVPVTPGTPHSFFRYAAP